MSKPDSPHSFAVGDPVVLTQLRRRGVIAEGPNRRGEFLVTCGLLSLWVAPDKLSPSAQESGGSSKKIQEKEIVRRRRPPDLPPPPSATIRLDLHGMTKEQALMRLEETLDRALRTEGHAGESICIELIHGMGKGTLREAVTKYLSQSKVVKHFRQDVRNAGVTWIYL